MSDPAKLKKVVEFLLRERNVNLRMDLVDANVFRVAGEFRDAGLIPKEVEDGMHVFGVDSYTLAAKLMNACQTSLVHYPEENFPKFIEILKRCGTTKPLAAEMESEFEQACELYI